MFDNIFNHKDFKLNKTLNVIGLNHIAQSAYIWDIFCKKKSNILIVTNTLYEANNLYKSLVLYGSDKVLLFPMDDFLVSEAIAISPDLMAKRIETLNVLTENKNNYVVITNLMGYLRFLPCIDLWKKSKINISKGMIVSKDDLINKLSIIGYERENIVTKTGEYAIRGYIIDIFPYGYDNPIRVELFDNEVEEIRTFDPSTQLSVNKIDDFCILPFTEFINEKQIEDIPKRQSLLPRVVNKISSLNEYVKDNITIFISLQNLKLSYVRIMEEVCEFKVTDIYRINVYMHDIKDLIPEKYINIFIVDNYNENDDCETHKTELIEQFNGNFEKINNYLLKLKNQKKNIIVCLDNDNMIDDFVKKVKINTVITNCKDYIPNFVNVIKYKMLNGFIIDDYAFLTTNEIYGKEHVVSYKSKFKYGSKIKDINKLKIGDYVVHISHGIGRYMGIVTLTSKGLKKDYIYLQYLGNDKLYIPVEKIEYICKYSSNEGVRPKLNKLNGTEWVKQKSRVKGKVRDIAKELISLSAKRKLVKGFPFLEDDAEQYSFENSFMYEATKDQLKACDEIKKDMEKPFPMDRLLCGDVGYGKTEVAFRAAFKAIRSGKQVSFLCPTTILSKQHYENAIARFSNFGVNIELLNRFTSEKNKKNILNDLKSGKIDLIIGTHSLLGNNVVYKDLGLLVIDEEQRFGVKHKEKIKNYKNSIDVLTLSATPIPRTLQMSLSGIRGLSLIETPPVDRYPIQTYVLRENDQVIKDAIYKELSREGQVFILYNSVEKIEEKVKKIKSLVPEISINYIHGQMPKKQIENTMENFVLGEYDVLVCTTIIETGIDIQNANTLIVFDADHFGLSQLYQIRGRIGRGKNIGYAYLMYNKNKELNDIAVKRLDAIKEFTELGSGYALAVRDLSIRGAGDILGSEQSGFIDTLGYDMYMRILNEEIEKLKNESSSLQNNDISDKEMPFIQVSTHISDVYADSDDIKIEIHKKINTIDSFKKFEEVKLELEDRFGKLDNNIIIYMLEELFQFQAKEKGVVKVEQSENIIKILLSDETSNKIDVIQFMSSLLKINNNFSVSYLNKKIEISLKIKNLDKHFLYYLIKMLDIIE